MAKLSFNENPKLRTSKKFIKIFGPRRKLKEKINQRYKDIAKAAQNVLEECMIGLVKLTKRITKQKNLCISGGVALNSVVNGKIIESDLFEKIYIYPASADDGTSVGAALWSYYTNPKRNRIPIKENRTPYLGYESNEKEILQTLKKYNLKYSKSKNIFKEVAKLISENKFVGWFSGRAEFGPRALGNRSILADPRKVKNKDLMNSKIKFREPFRPFAPVVLKEFSDDYFESFGVDSPYMILVFKVKDGKEKIIPAVTHIDQTARVQTITKEQNERFWFLINEFYKLTGVPILLNTSFNRRGEVIVNSPEDAVRCFLGSGLDALVLEDYLILK